LKKKLESGKFLEDTEFTQEQQKLFEMLNGIKNEVEEIRRVGSSGKFGLGKFDKNIILFICKIIFSNGL